MATHVRVSGFIYPVVTHWQWGGGFLSEGKDYGGDIGHIHYDVRPSLLCRHNVFCQASSYIKKSVPDIVLKWSLHPRS